MKNTWIILIEENNKNKNILEKSIRWFLNKYPETFQTQKTIKVNTFFDYSDIGCFGQTYIGKKNVDYVIDIMTNQSKRDLVATIMHEMVHVMQWETNIWSGDGEKQAEKMQYKLTDEMLSPD